MSQLTLRRHRQIYLTFFWFSCQVQLPVKVSCQYHQCFWSYDNFLLQGIEQKSGMRKYPHLSLAQHLGFGQTKDTKFGTNLSNEMLLNAAKYQCCRFYHLWVINSKQTGMVEITLPPLLAFLTNLHIQAFVELYQGNFLHVFRACIIISWCQLPEITKAGYLNFFWNIQSIFLFHLVLCKVSGSVKHRCWFSEINVKNTLKTRPFMFFVTSYKDLPCNNL